MGPGDSTVWGVLWKLALGAGVIYSAMALLVFVFQSSLIYFPRSELVATPKDAGLQFESVSFTTSDGILLHGWHVPHPTPAATVLFCHGNGGNISHRLESLLQFHRMNLSVFIFDYRGYGRSNGKPDEHGTYADVEAAWQYLSDDRGIPADSIVLFGRSLGGAIAAWLAQKHTPGALIIESSFTSIPDVGAQLYPFLPVRFLSRFQYNTLAYIRSARCPVLIIHSRDDEMMPFSHGQKLFDAAPEPKRFLEIRGGHNDGFLISGRMYEEGFRSFLSLHFPTNTGKQP